MLKFFLALVTALTLALPAVAQRSSHMSCGSYEGLTRQILDNVSAMTQVLNNSFGQTVTSRNLAAGFCGLKQFPSGSTAQLVGFHEVKRYGLIYAVVAVEYFPVNLSTGQRSNWASTTYAVDAVVSSNRWQVGFNRQCAKGYRGTCLMPRSCQVLKEFPISGNLLGFTPRNQLPDYVQAAGNCQTFIIR